MKPSTLLPLIGLIATSSAAATPHLTPRRPASHKLTHTPPSSIPNPGGKSAFATTSTPESTKAGYSLAMGTSPNPLRRTEAYFTIPVASMPETGPTAGNQNGVYQASYWIGIDGLASCPHASLRAGVDTFWDSGMQTTNAWYEWYPSSPAVDFGNFTVKQGEMVRISALADEDGRGGTVTVERVVDILGEVLGSVSHRLEGKDGDDVLCLREGNFVVEDYPLADRPEYPLALANFTSVLFERMCVAGGGEGECPGGYILDDDPTRLFDIRLEAQGGKLTSCGMENAMSVRCDRVVEKL